MIFIDSLQSMCSFKGGFLNRYMEQLGSFAKQFSSLFDLFLALRRINGGSLILHFVVISSFHLNEFILLCKYKTYTCLIDLFVYCNITSKPSSLCISFQDIQFMERKIQDIEKSMKRSNDK